VLGQRSRSLDSRSERSIRPFRSGVLGLPETRNDLFKGPFWSHSRPPAECIRSPINNGIPDVTSRRVGRARITSLMRLVLLIRVSMRCSEGSKRDPLGARIWSRGRNPGFRGLDPLSAADGPTLHRITRRCTHALTRYAYAYVGA